MGKQSEKMVDATGEVGRYNGRTQLGGVAGQGRLGNLGFYTMRKRAPPRSDSLKLAPTGASQGDPSR